jgi:hypothetical protein
MKKKKEKANTGRPTLYTPEKCAEAEKWLSQGYSKEATAGRLGICRTTLYLWCQEYPEFLNSIKKGLDKGLAFIEQRLIALMSGQKVEGFDHSKCNVTAIIFVLKTRHHEIYGEKMKLEHLSNVENLSDDELNTKIKLLEKSLRK